MTNLSTFNYLSNNVRVVAINDQPWFLAADVCRVLGLSTPSVAILPLGADEKAKADLGLSGRLPNIISESGLYKLVMCSDKPEARQFQDWVTREVLPSIRNVTEFIFERNGRGELCIEAVQTGAMCDFKVDRSYFRT